MNEFLERIWLDNPIKNYLLVLAVILFVLLLKRIISHYFAGLLFKFVNRIWSDVDKKSFTSLLVQPLGFFLTILVAIISLHKLVFPAELNVDIYDYSIKRIIHSIGTIILIASFIWLLLRLLDFIATILEKKADLTHDQTDNQLIVFFRDFFKVILGIIGVTMILKFAFGFNISSLLTGLSIVGAAIALALRESLENLIASFIIFFDRPFTTGDLVKVLNVTGTVERIGLRSTRIRTDQKTFVTVPNKQMVDSVLDNLTLRSQRRADIRLDLSLETSSEKLESLVGAIKKLLVKDAIESSHVMLSEINNQSFVVLVEYYTAPVAIDEFNQLKQQVNLEILRLLESEKIEIAGANTEVRIVQR